MLYPLSYRGFVAWLSGIRPSVIYPLAMVSGTLKQSRTRSYAERCSPSVQSLDASSS